MIKCFLVAMMSLEDNKRALYQLLAHPKYALRGDGRGPCFRALGVGCLPDLSVSEACSVSQEKDTLSAQPCLSFRENGKNLGA